MMSAATCGLACLQGILSALVLIGALLLLLLGSDHRTDWRIKAGVIGLALWAVWLLWSAAKGQPDSLAGNAMTALVATVLLAYGRQIRGILDGEQWWPKHTRKDNP
jgi:hypothetical protein